MRSIPRKGEETRLRRLPREGLEPAPNPPFHCEDETALTSQSTYSLEAQRQSRETPASSISGRRAQMGTIYMNCSARLRSLTHRLGNGWSCPDTQSRSGSLRAPRRVHSNTCRCHQGSPRSNKKAQSAGWGRSGGAGERLANVVEHLDVCRIDAQPDRLAGADAMETPHGRRQAFS